MTATSLGFKKATPVDPAGSLHLVVARDGRRTRPVTTAGHGVLQVLRPLYLDDSGQVTYFFVNPGGAYFGERYRYDVEVHPQAHLLLSTQGATRIYKTPNDPAVQESAYRVAAGARLESVPDQTIAYRNAAYRSRTVITVADDSQVFVSDVVTPGWDPEGERFTYTDVHMRTEVRAEDGDKLVCVDNVRIQPRAIGASLDGPGYLEGHSHMGSVLVIGGHTVGEYADEVHRIVDNCEGVRVGVTAGSRNGISWLMVRAIAHSTGDLTKMILAVNEHDRLVTTGQDRLNLRRY